MNSNRRSLLKTAGAFGILLAAGVISSKEAAAFDLKAGFEAKTLQDALAALGGTVVDSKEITITSPEIAENGAVVPVSVSTSLPNTSEIYIFVEKKS